MLTEYIAPDVPETEAKLLRNIRYQAAELQKRFGNDIWIKDLDECDKALERSICFFQGMLNALNEIATPQRYYVITNCGRVLSED